MRFVLAGCGLILAALPATAIAQTPLPMATVVPEGTILDVTATGRVARTPDIATIRAGVVTEAPAATTALADNARRMEAVVKALRAAGIAARDLSTSNVALSPQYRYEEKQPPVITGYQATNAVTVKFRDVAKAGGVLDALVRAGANQIDGPALSLSEPEAALDEARTAAVARARARAALYAKAAGLTVDRIVSIDEAGESDGDRPQFQRSMGIAASMARDSTTVVLPGETDITAALRVRFLLK